MKKLETSGSPCPLSVEGQGKILECATIVIFAQKVVHPVTSIKFPFLSSNRITEQSYAVGFPVKNFKGETKSLNLQN